MLGVAALVGSHVGESLGGALADRLLVGREQLDQLIGHLHAHREMEGDGGRRREMQTPVGDVEVTWEIRGRYIGSEMHALSR